MGVLIVLAVMSNIYIEVTPSDIFPWGNTNLPWHAEFIFQAVLFMYIGYIFREKWEKNFDRINGPILAMCLFFVYLVIVYAFTTAYTTHNLLYYVFHIYIRRIVGVMMLVSISKLVKINEFIRFIGQNTLLYFVLQGKIYSFLQSSLRLIAEEWYEMILGNVLYSSIFDFVMGLVISVMLIPPVYLINTHCPFLIGKGKKK